MPVKITQNPGGREDQMDVLRDPLDRVRHPDQEQALAEGLPARRGELVALSFAAAKALHGRHVPKALLQLVRGGAARCPARLARAPCPAGQGRCRYEGQANG